MQFIVQASEKAGYRPGEDISICIDPASSEFYTEGKYHLRTERSTLSAEEMTGYYAELIKLNQTGALSETFAAVALCQQHGWGTFISHRSGETTDSFIADMTGALRAGHLKTGAPCRGERVEKYNQLMRIEQAPGADAHFAGRSAFIHKS